MVEERNAEILQLEKEVKNIKSEIVLSATYKENFNRTHDENEKLKSKIKILETKLEFADVAGGAMNGNEVGGDSNFLNNVIIKQQTRIKTLELKVAELEQMLVGGSDSASGSDLPIDDPVRKAITIRPFCDICDCFDLHDTEDCPTQSQIDHERSLHVVTNNFDASEQRSYCEDCGVFGHWTDDCTESEMY